MSKRPSGGYGNPNDSLLAANQNLRSHIFRNQQMQKNARNKDDILNSSMKSTASVQRVSGATFDNIQVPSSEQKMQKHNIMNQNGRGNPIGPMGGAPGRRDSRQGNNG